MTLKTGPSQDVPLEPLQMLWRRRIPLGCITVIAGIPGVGKSMLSALIATELSKAGLVTLISNTEDNHRSVLAPRLAAQAGVMDGSRPGLVYLVDEDESWHLPRDLHLLEMAIRDVGASLVILDPAGAHFFPERRLHERSVLRRLQAIARRTGSAILCVHHTTKGGGSAIERLGGSMGGLAGSARAAYLFGHHGHDLRALSCVKINGAPRPAAMVFDTSIEDLTRKISAPLLVHWSTDRLADDDPLSVFRRGRPDADLDAEVAEWLTCLLAAGENFTRLRGEIKGEASKAKIPWSTCQRMAIQLGFVETDGANFATWRLSRDHPLRLYPDGVILPG